MVTWKPYPSYVLNLHLSLFCSCPRYECSKLDGVDCSGGGDSSGSDENGSHENGNNSNGSNFNPVN